MTDHGFRDPEHALRVLREFVEGPDYVHVSARTASATSSCADCSNCARGLEPAFCLQPSAFAFRLNQRFTASTPRSPTRTACVVRLDSFIGAYGARATLYELWTQPVDV